MTKGACVLAGFFGVSAIVARVLSGVGFDTVDTIAVFAPGVAGPSTGPSTGRKTSFCVGKARPV